MSLLSRLQATYSKVRASAVAAAVVGFLAALPQLVDANKGLLPGLPSWASAAITFLVSPVVVGVVGFAKKELVRPAADPDEVTPPATAETK